MLSVTHVSKSYPTASGPLPVLADITMALAPGQAAAITGPSGSGKSSLLYLLGALDAPTTGTITIDGQNPFALDPAAIADFRNRRIGFVFQDHCLLPQCSVLENVLVPTLVAGRDPGVHDRALRLIERVGLSARIGHRPAQLSGGEKQRVAIARALVRQPHLVLCDEPTGNLDADTAASVASLLLELHQQQQTILLVVTHSAELAARFPMRFELKNTRLLQAPLPRDVAPAPRDGS